MIFVFFIKNRAAAVLAIVKLMFIRGINVCSAGFIWWYGRVEGLDANKQHDDEGDCAKVPLPSLGMCWDGAAAPITPFFSAPGPSAILAHTHNTDFLQWFNTVTFAI